MSQDIQIVDKNDNPSDAASISETRENGLWHRYVRILVLDKKGNMLLQLRGPKNVMFTNCWDFTICGHVDFGEEYLDAAIREAKEEIGLTKHKLSETDYYKSSIMYDNQQINRFNKTYQTFVDPNYNFQLDSGEVSEIKWYSVAEVKTLVKNNPDKVTDGLVRFVQKL